MRVANTAPNAPNANGALVCLDPASESTRCRRARHAALGGSPVGGHSDVFSGGSLWTVTGRPLFDLYCPLLVLLCAALIRHDDYTSADVNFDGYAYFSSTLLLVLSN